MVYYCYLSGTITVRLKSNYCLNNHFSFYHNGHSMNNYCHVLLFTVVSERVNTSWEYYSNYRGLGTLMKKKYGAWNLYNN